MSALRMTALQLADGSDLSRCDDQQVLHTITAACTSGRLVTALGAGKPMLYRLVPAPAPSPPPPAPASAPRPGAAVLPPAAVQSTFEPSLDVSAMVAVLQQAANDGTPFCEECARLAARRAAQGGTA